MSKAQDYFNYYCLDKTRDADSSLTIAYRDNTEIKKFPYKIGFISRVRQCISYILYKEEDIDNLFYVSCDYIDNNLERLLLYPIDKEEYDVEFKYLGNITLSEFTSLLDFNIIYEDLKSFIDTEWNNFRMDDLLYV